MMRFWSASAVVAVVLCVATASGAEIGAGRSDDLESLKKAVQASPTDPALRLGLGIAYFQAGNDFWAVRTLSALIAERPGDCTARVWLGLAYMRRAFPQDAIDVVAAVPEGASCTEPEVLRLRMVEALALKAIGKPAGPAVRAAERTGRGWIGDVRALPVVAARASPERVPELSWTIDVAGGYTSNARMGSATDEALTGDSAASALAMVDARVRIVPDFGGPVRPVLEFQPRFQWYFADSAMKVSYFELTGQAGILIRAGLPRVFLGYRPDWLLLPAGFRTETGPVPYMVGHRGEFEVEILPELMVFGGAGTRKFHEMSKSRTEVDVGLGGSASPARDITVLWAAGARYYNARHEAWDLVGGSLTSAFVMRLPHELSSRISATVSMDWYPNSAAAGGVDPFNAESARLDLFVKTGWQLWAPPLEGTRFGLSYEFSYRDSSAETYSYTDHRLLLRFRWTGKASLHKPRIVATPEGIDRIEWGGGVGAMEERVQDMLRQDEQVQRSSSCAN